MSNIFNTALAEGLDALYGVMGERFFARPPLGTGNALIGPFTGLFSEVTAEAVETDTGFIRIQTRRLTTSTATSAIINRGQGASIEDPQGTLWRIRGMVARDQHSRTYQLYREAKNDVQG